MTKTSDSPANFMDFVKVLFYGNKIDFFGGLKQVSEILWGPIKPYNFVDLIERIRICL